MDLNFRRMARGWRSGSKARAARLGRDIGVLPSIDEVEAHLKVQPLFCFYCGTKLGTSKRGKIHMDHKLSISRGGDAALHNLALACHRCNKIKGECSESEFRDLVQLVSYWEDKGKSLFTRLQLGFFR